MPPHTQTQTATAAVLSARNHHRGCERPRAQNEHSAHQASSDSRLWGRRGVRSYDRAELRLSFE